MKLQGSQISFRILLGGLWACILSGALVQAQGTQAPHEAALAIVFARDPAAVERYLLESTKEQVGRIDQENRQGFMRSLMVAQELEEIRYKVQRTPTGDPLLLIQSPGSPDPIEVILEKEQAGETEALLEAVVRGKGFSPIRIVVRMRMENGDWRLAGVDPGFPTPAALFLKQLDDPELAQKIEEAMRSLNEAASITNLRSLSDAVQEYFANENRLPESLTALAMPPGYIDEKLASGDVAGYVYLYKSGDGYFTYTLEAHPKVPGRTGNRFFFMDESGIIRVETGKPAGANSPPL